VHLRNRAGIPGRQEVIAYNEVVEVQNVRRTEGKFLANCRSMVSVLTTTKLLSMRYVRSHTSTGGSARSRKTRAAYARSDTAHNAALISNANTKKAAATRAA
jgi:hypothetical protein